MSVAFEGSTYSIIYEILLLVFSILATICSILILYLIYKMRLDNGHILLIKTMSWFQLIYDISIFTRNVYLGSSVLMQISYVSQIIGGLMGTFISNIIAFIAFYVVTNIKTFQVYQYYPYIMVGISVPTLVTTILYIISCSPGYSWLELIAVTNLYYYLRLISIGINFLLSFATICRIQRPVTQPGAVKSIHQEAIETLAMRLIYYPVVQTISRAAVAWYEEAYSFDLSPSNPTRNEFIGLCFVAVFTPSASFGYLWIFLLMQPNAWECLKCTLLCRTYVPKRSMVFTSQRSSQPVSESTTKNTLHSRNTGVGTVETDNHCVYSNQHSSGTLVFSSLTLGKLDEADDDDLWFVVHNNEQQTKTDAALRNISTERANSVGM